MPGEYTPFRASQVHQIPVIYRATEWSTLAANSDGRPTHAGTTQEPEQAAHPLVEGSSPSGPITSLENHSLMSLRPGDSDPLVHPIGEIPGASDEGRRDSGDRSG